LKQDTQRALDNSEVLGEGRVNMFGRPSGMRFQLEFQPKYPILPLEHRLPKSFRLAGKLMTGRRIKPWPWLLFRKNKGVEHVTDEKVRGDDGERSE
jgi:hypothetical protein